MQRNKLASNARMVRNETLWLYIFFGAKRYISVCNKYELFALFNKCQNEQYFVYCIRLSFPNLSSTKSQHPNKPKTHTCTKQAFTVFTFYNQSIVFVSIDILMLIIFGCCTTLTMLLSKDQTTIYT